MAKIKGIFPSIAKVEDSISLATITILLATVTVYVFYRDVIQTVLIGPCEISRYIFIWLVWVGGASAVRHRNHISVNIVGIVLKSEKAKKILTTIHDSIMLVIAGLFSYVIVPYIVAAFKGGWNGMELSIPIWLVATGMLIGGVLMSIYSIRNLIHDVRDFSIEIAD